MTSINETALETVEVRLMPHEGTCLQRALEALSGQPRGDSSREWLAPIVDRLDNSNAVASWLGEYVRLELKPEEVVELLEAIVAILNSDTCPSRKADIALSNVGEKLATFGYSRRAGR